MPLIVDLDGTLSRTDTLVESLLRLLARHPLTLLFLLPQFFRDRAAFKQLIAQRVHLDPASLAYNSDVIGLAEAARHEGRSVYLVTGANEAIARSVAAHLQIFDGVFASDSQVNLTRENKARLLCGKFGERGYAYIGDAAADVPVWRHAAAAIVMAPRASLLRGAHAACEDVTTIGAGPDAFALLRMVFRAMRIHQWTKNFLVFVPIFGAHRGDAGSLLRAVLAFGAVSLCASSVYILNDLLDLPHDRLHPTKRLRPFAAGTLDLRVGPPLFGLCLMGGFAAALLLPWYFGALLAGYVVLTLAYSFRLKRQAILDVMVLAGLYTIRLFLGGAATRTPISFWLLAFAMFLFFCLAVVKRQTELVRVAAPGESAASGRGYRLDDLGTLRNLSSASGMAAVMVLALYVNSDEVRVLYRSPEALWALCPILLFWVSRVLMLSQRGALHDDPVVFALTDRVSLLTGLAALAAVLAASM